MTNTTNPSSKIGQIINFSKQIVSSTVERAMQKDLIQNSSYHKLSDIIIKISSKSADLKTINNTLTFLNNFRAQLCNSFYKIRGDNERKKSAIILKNLRQLMREKQKQNNQPLNQLSFSGEYDDLIKEIFQVSLDEKQELEKTENLSQKEKDTENNYTKIFFLLKSNIEKQIAALEELKINPQNETAISKLTSLYMEGKKLYSAYLVDEENLTLIESQEKEILSKLNLRRQNLKAKIWGSIRTAIRVGILSIALIWTINTYENLFNIGKTGHDQLKIEKVTGTKTIDIFLKNLKQMDFNNTTEMKQITKNENFENLFSSFEDTLKNSTKDIELIDQNLAEKMLQEINNIVSQKELTEMGITQNDLQKVVNEIAYRGRIYIVKEYMYSEFYSKWPIKNKITLYLWATGGKPMFSTEAEQVLVRNIKTYAGNESYKVLQEFKIMIEKWVEEYRKTKAKGMWEAVKELNLVKFLNNFVIYMTTNKLTLKILIIWGGASVAYILLTRIPILGYVLRKILPIKKIFKGLTRDSIKDAKVIFEKEK